LYNKTLTTNQVDELQVLKYVLLFITSVFLSSFPLTSFSANTEELYEEAQLLRKSTPVTVAKHKMAFDKYLEATAQQHAPSQFQAALYYARGIEGYLNQNMSEAARLFQVAFKDGGITLTQMVIHKLFPLYDQLKAHGFDLKNHCLVVIEKWHHLMNQYNVELESMDLSNPKRQDLEKKIQKIQEKLSSLGHWH
jgi:hypothetical protein